MKDFKVRLISVMTAFLLLVVLSSCGSKVAFTDQIREEFGLDTDTKIRKVQFYISQTITLERSRQSGTQGTADKGVLVASKNREEDRIIIQAQTPAIFEGYGKNGEMIIRFETGQGRFLTFNVRRESSSARYYLVATWTQNRGGEIDYANERYSVSSSAGNAYLMVLLKKMQKTKRKDRRVKGMKV